MAAMLSDKPRKINWIGLKIAKNDESQEAG